METRADLFILSICSDKNARPNIWKIQSAHRSLKSIRRAIQQYRQRLYEDWYASRGSNFNRGNFVKGEKFTNNHLWKITPINFTK